MKKLLLITAMFMATIVWSHGADHSHATYLPNKTTLCFDYNDGSTAGKITQAIAILSEKNCNSFRYWGHYHLGNDGRPLFGNATLNFGSQKKFNNPSNDVHLKKLNDLKINQNEINMDIAKDFRVLNQKIKDINVNSELITDQSSRIEFLEDRLLKLERELLEKEKLERELLEKEKIEKELLIKNQLDEKALLVKKKYEVCLDEAKKPNDLLECTRIK